MSSLEHAASFPVPPGPVAGALPGSSQVRARAASTTARGGVVALGAAGLAAAVVLALFGSPVGSRAPSAGARLAAALGAAPRGLAANRLALLAAGGLLVLWLLAVRLAARGRLTTRAGAVLGLLWAVPLALAGPLLSADLHSYVAYGRVVAQGADPYTVPPGHLGGAAVAAVDPRWLGTPSVYGPVALGVFRLAVAAGPAAEVVLRLLALAAVAGSAAFLAAAAPAPRRPLLLAAWGLSPVALVFLVGGAHVDALIALLAAAAVWAHRRGHPLVAVVLAAAAAGVKPPAALLVVALLAAGPWRRVPARAAAAVAVAAGPALWLGDPLGVLRAESAVAGSTRGAGPADLLAAALRLPVDAARWALLAAAAAAALLALVRWRRDPAAAAGAGLLATAVAAPVVFPWYLAWGAPCLLAAYRRRWWWAAVAVLAAGSLCGLPSPLHAPPG